ncbi:MAG: 50S ribosomal protein L24 [Clostridia bacterium]|nr:50S ribosomal protein L24 [Clostridia bacterium]
MNVKVNDNVLVIAGKDKGKQGKVLATSPKANTVTVEGIRVQKKHEKARKANETSKIVEVPGPIDASNVKVVCPACGKAVRVKHSVVDGKKVRVCACGAVLDQAYTKKAKVAATEEAAPKKRTRKRVQKVAAPEAEAPVEETVKTENE